MKIKIILSLVVLGLFIQCKAGKSEKNTPKTEKISDANNYKYSGLNIAGRA